MGQLILVGGGARSGKSTFALNWAKARGQRRLFVATAQAYDGEMEQRIRRHRLERGDSFETLECPLEIPDALQSSSADVILIDCLTLWISNLLGTDASNDDILERVDQLIAAAMQSRADVIVVTNEVGMGLVSEYELGRRFQDLTGFAHQRLAAVAAEIYLAALGCVLRIKPDPIAMASPPCAPQP